jgi:effector-binding domain-containing protein
MSAPSHASSSQEHSSTLTNSRLSYEISVSTTQETTALVIKRKVNAADAGAAIAGIFTKLQAYLNTQGITPMGPPFTRTFSYHDGVLEFESGFPVSQNTLGTGDIVQTKLPASMVATTIHIGTQETSADAYAAIEQWLATHQRKQVGAPWEIYLTDPSQTTPEQSKMQIFYPIQ